MYYYCILFFPLSASGRRVRLADEPRLGKTCKIHARWFAFLLCWFALAGAVSIVSTGVNSALRAFPANQPNTGSAQSPRAASMSDDEWETEEEHSETDAALKAEPLVTDTPLPANQDISTNIVPEFGELVQAVAAVKSENPEFGQKRILAAIKASHAQWAVSEKRLQKAIAESGASGEASCGESGGGYRSSGAATSAPAEPLPPVTLDENGDIACCLPPSLSFAKTHSLLSLSFQTCPPSPPRACLSPYFSLLPRSFPWRHHQKLYIAITPSTSVPDRHAPSRKQYGCWC